MIRRGLTSGPLYKQQYRVLTGTRRRDLRVDALDCERGDMPDIVDPWEPPYKPWQIGSVREAEAAAIATERTRHEGLTIATWAGETLTGTAAAYGLSKERCRAIQRETACRMIDRLAAARRTPADVDAGIPDNVGAWSFYAAKRFAEWDAWNDWRSVVDAAVMEYRSDCYGPPARRGGRKRRGA